MQTTLQRSVEFSGVGLHSGQDSKIAVRPAKAGTGIVFFRADLARANGRDKDAYLVPARADRVTSANHGTTVANEFDVSVATVEHLMAALSLARIENALIEVHGPEIPILDGSSSAFFKEFNAAGVKAQDAPTREIVVREAIEVRMGDRFVRFEPAEEFQIDLSIAFDDCLIGRQSISVHIDESVDRERLAAARTFCRLHEVETLRQSGLIRGGSLHNSLVVDGARLLNDEALRDPNEFALHKALDLIGDLYLLGAPLRGAVVAEKPGHDINVRAACALAKSLGSEHAEAAQIAVGA